MKALRWQSGRAADYGNAMADRVGAVQAARGHRPEDPQGLGSVIPCRRQARASVDDPGLDPLFERPAELGMPVAITRAIPRPSCSLPTQERALGRAAGAPEWSFPRPTGAVVEEIYAAFERRVARHPKTTFIGVHFGNDPRSEHVAQMLDKYPNLYRHPPTRARDWAPGRGQDAVFYEKYQDRICSAPTWRRGRNRTA